MFVNVLQIAILQYRMGRTTGIVQFPCLLLWVEELNHNVKYIKSKCMFLSSTATSLFAINF